VAFYDLAKGRKSVSTQIGVLDRQSIGRLNGIILPERICGKVEGFDEGRSGTTTEPKPEGFDANAPGPSGFRAAGACFVGLLGRWNRIDLRNPSRRSPPRPRNRIDAI
jgi:hypothetical protein